MPLFAARVCPTWSRREHNFPEKPLAFLEAVAGKERGKGDGGGLFTPSKRPLPHYLCPQPFAISPEKYHSNLLFINGLLLVTLAFYESSMI